MAELKGSYINVEEADEYHVSVGNTAWGELETEAKEIALRRATSFIDIVGKGKWRGRKTDPGQPLAWPRAGAFDEDGYVIPDHTIPLAVRHATAVAALRIAGGDDLLPDREENIASESVAGAVSTSYFENKSSIPKYTEIYGLLSGLVTGRLGEEPSFTQTHVTRGYVTHGDI